MAAVDVKSAPTRELGTSSLFLVPTWGALTAASIVNPLEHDPNLMWPTSVRITYPRMRNDTQLSGLFRGTTLPIRRYVWGIDPNGAPPAMVDAVCKELNLQPIDQAWKAFQTGESEPQGRSRNRFSFDQLQALALQAAFLGHYLFEQVYDVVRDGPAGQNGGWFAHIRKLAPRAPWTISQFYTSRDGGLAGIRQQFQQMGEPPIPVSQLVAFVFDQEPGDWTGRSMYRSCYREWSAKDLLIRIDVVNHQKAGGVLLNEAPQGATPAEIQALGQMAAAMQVGGGGAVPAGTNPVFIRATGSDVIASINRHDEAMAREFLMMFMALGTSSSGGNRAMASSFIDWFAISQETIAIWFRDVFNEHVIEDFVDLNWGESQDFVPRLAFRRPEAANPLDQLAAAVNANAGAPVAVVPTGKNTPPDTSGDIPVAAARDGDPNAVVVDPETRQLINDAHAEWERDRKPHRYKTVAAAALQLPDRALRRQPTAVEVTASVDFKALDDAWVSEVEQLVSQWQTIRAQQIAQLVTLIENAGGDMAALSTVQAISAGGDLIAARLATMAHTGVSEAKEEAAAQGATAAPPDIAALEAQLTTRAGALAQVLTNSISTAAQTRALQLTGASLTPADVAAQVGDYLTSLTDAYLTDQFSGAMSAARTGGRLAAMDAGQADRFYISALLDVNCCEACVADDGTEYATAEEIAAQMPSGFNKDCLGGPRCRCVPVAVYGESTATT